MWCSASRSGLGGTSPGNLARSLRAGSSTWEKLQANLVSSAIVQRAEGEGRPLPLPKDTTSSVCHKTLHLLSGPCEVGKHVYKCWKPGSCVGSSFYKSTSEAHWGTWVRQNDICATYLKLFVSLVSGLPGNPGRPGTKGELCFFPDTHFLSKHFIWRRISCSAAQSLNQQWHLVALGKEVLWNSW